MAHLPFRGGNFLATVSAYLQKHQPDVLIVHNSGQMGALLDSWDLPAAALVVRDQDVSWASGWKMLDHDKIVAALDVLDRSVRVGATGIEGHKITHQVFPEWNEGRTLLRPDSSC